MIKSVFHVSHFLFAQAAVAMKSAFAENVLVATNDHEIYEAAIFVVEAQKDFEMNRSPNCISETSLAGVHSASHATSCPRCPQRRKILQSVQQFIFEVQENRSTFAQISYICFGVTKDKSFSY